MKTLYAVFNNLELFPLTAGESGVIHHPHEAAEAFGRICKGISPDEISELVNRFEDIQDETGSVVFSAVNLVDGFHDVSVSCYLASVQATSRVDHEKAYAGHVQSAFMVGAFASRVMALDMSGSAR